MALLHYVHELELCNCTCSLCSLCRGQGLQLVMLSRGLGPLIYP